MRHEGTPSHAIAVGQLDEPDKLSGGALIAVRCGEANAVAVTTILDTGLDIDEHQSNWRAGGWQARDDAASGIDAGAQNRIGHGRVRIYDHIA